MGVVVGQGAGDGKAGGEYLAGLSVSHHPSWQNYVWLVEEPVTKKVVVPNCKLVESRRGSPIPNSPWEPGVCRTQP